MFRSEYRTANDTCDSVGDPVPTAVDQVVGQSMKLRGWFASRSGAADKPYHCRELSFGGGVNESMRGHRGEDRQPIQLDNEVAGVVLHEALDHVRPKRRLQGQLKFVD
jgi:hypothetical protein